MNVAFLEAWNASSGVQIPTKMTNDFGELIR